MNISGIRPTSYNYAEPFLEESNSNAFGAYDDKKLQKPEASELKVNKISSINSHAQLEKAVNTMKRDKVLHKYQKFMGDSSERSFIGRGIIENFSLA